MKGINLTILLLIWIMVSCTNIISNKKQDNNKGSLKNINKVETIISDSDFKNKYDSMTPLDTIVSNCSNGQKLFSVIYEFSDDTTFGEKYITKFKVINEQDEILFISKDDTLRRFYEGPWDDWYKITPIYKINCTNLFSIELNFLIKNKPEKNVPINVIDDIKDYLTGNRFSHPLDFELFDGGEEKFAHKFIKYQFLKDSDTYKIMNSINYTYPIRTTINIDSVKNYIDSITIAHKLYGNYLTPAIKEIILLNINGYQELNSFIEKDKGLYTSVIYYYLSFLDRKNLKKN